MQTQVLDAIDDPSLRAYVVWVPVLPADSEAAAWSSRVLVRDRRALHFWDAGRSLSRPFAQLLGLPADGPAWDVYLAYGSGARWGELPPKPAFWHHQLGDAIDAPVLDGDAFAAGVREMIAEG
jgi:hypothetical protein